MTEVWKDVVGYEGIYEVSNFGFVRSLDREIKINKCIHRRKGAAMKIHIDRIGYERVYLSKNAISKRLLVHRIVLAAFIGESKLPVNHIDGNKTNNNLNNLEYCTPKENMNHAVNIGLIKSNALLNAEEITKDYKDGLGFRELNKKYSTSYDSIKKILVSQNIKMNSSRNKEKVFVDVDEMIRMFESGYNKSEISRNLNVSRDVVAYRLKKVTESN